MKLYVHGNCQAPALADLMAEACGGGVEAVSRQVYSLDLERDLEGYLDDVATADVILTQPVADNYRSTEVLSSSWLRANARPDAIVLMFPVIYHRGQLPQCFTLADYHDGRLAYHDAHAIDFFLRGEGVGDFLAATSRTDFLPESFVQSEMARTTLELLRRENAEGVDVGVSDIIASRMGVGQPLHTINHPSRGVMAELANRILERLGQSERASPEGLDMLDRFIMPPYLSTALAIDHTGQSINFDDVRVEGVYESRRSFYEGVFERYHQIGTDALRTAIKTNPEVGAYLKRFRSTSNNMPEPRDVGPLITALYDVFFNRAARTDEILHQLQTLRHQGFTEVVSAFPRSREFVACGGLDAMMARFGSDQNVVGSTQVEPSSTMPAARMPQRIHQSSEPVSLVSKMKVAYNALTGASIKPGTSLSKPASVLPASIVSDDTASVRGDVTRKPERIR